MIPIRLGLPNSAVILFNRLIREILPKINRLPLSYDYNENHYNKLKVRKDKVVKCNDILMEYTLIPIGSTGAVLREDSRPLMHAMVTDHSDSDNNKDTTSQK